MKDLVKILADRDDFTILMHKNPDGDAVGSALALYAFLKKKGKNVRVFSPTKIPEIYGFLPFSEDIRVVKGFDDGDYGAVTIFVDCSDVRRVPGFNISKAGLVINIDHHDTNEMFGDYNIVYPDKSSSGEIVLEIMESCDSSAIDSDIATCIYTALYTDTGGFKYSNTNADSFKNAQKLIEYGVNPWYVAKEVYENYPYRRMRLLAEALKTLKLHLNGKVASIFVTLDMYEKTGALVEDTEEFVDFARAIKGVEIAVFIREKEEGGVKVSLRSKGNFDVSKIAKKFGGGGHHSAAGCELGVGIDEAFEQILSEIKLHV